MNRIVVIIDNCLQLEFKAIVKETSDGMTIIQESNFLKEAHELVSIMIMHDKQKAFARYKGFTVIMDIVKLEENSEGIYISCKCNLFGAGIVIKPFKELDSDTLDNVK